jgi:hypothetical protein
MNPCCGLMGRIFGHSFRPIFDKEIGVPSVVPSQEVLMQAAKNISGVQSDMSDLESLVEMSKPEKSIYVLSFCERCGKIVRESYFSHKGGE